MPFADTSDAKIYYEIHGDGPPLLLVPGFGCTVEIYFAQTPVLSKHFQTVIFDPRGAGRSDTPADGYSMQIYADDCVAVLRDAGFDSAHVLGTSFGGMIAQNLAVRHPDAVRRMILGCTTPGGTHHVLPPQENLATFLAAGEVEDPAAATRMRYPLHYSDAYVAQHDDEIVARSIDTAALRSSPEGRAGQLAAVNGHDTFDGLPSITAPTLVAHGDLDGVVPVENGEILASRMPNARLTLYEGAKHMFFVERAAEFNRDIIDFLEENER